MADYRELRFRSACGRLELFARDYPGADSSAPALLLMHGLTRNSADFEPLAAHLSRRYRLVVPDQRGRGRSQHDGDPTNYRPNVYVADMWTLLDLLAIDSVITIGTSMGGLISLAMGAACPERVRAMVLNDIGAELMCEGLDRIRSYVGGSATFESWNAAANRCEEINRDAFDGLSHSDWIDFARRTCEELPDGRVRFAYDPAISESMADEEPTTVPPELWPIWEALAHVPVLVIRGTKSDILSAATVTRMQARHAGPFVHVDIHGRGHAPMLNEPVALAAIENFLSTYG